MNEMLQQLVLVFVVAGGVLAFFNRLRVPAAAGLLVAGVIIGPHGIGVLTERGEIEQLADLGIMLLMFSVGMDFTPDRLRELVRAAGMGVLQMGICIVVTALAAVALVDRWAEAVFLGFLVAHTSSTLMLKLYLDRGEVDSPQVRLGLGISITQDLSALPMLLAIPMMAGTAGGSASAFGLNVLKVLGVLALAVALARWVIPLWLEHVIHSRSRELFLMFVVIISLGTAWATLAVGLSGALGAFLAGLAIASSSYSHQILAEVVPFRDLLISLFFISVGMLVDVAVMAQFVVPAVLLVLGVLVLKYLSGFVPVLVWGYPLRIATLVGVGMAQIGEFAFVVAHGGRAAGLMPDAWFQVFILVAVLTMAVNPFLIAAGPRLARALAGVSWLRRFEGLGAPDASEDGPADPNRVMIAGYGLNGRTVARALQTLEVPHVVLDVNPVAVREAQQRGEPVLFGDCTRAEVLRKAGLDQTRVYVVAISDLRATRQAVQVARHENPELYVIVRTKYIGEIEVLRSLGADDVIAEELETSLEILARVLRSFNLSRQRIEEVVQHFRGDAYQAFRGPTPLPHPDLLGQVLPALQIETVTIDRDSPAAGKSLRDLDLRARTGATLLAVQREGHMQTIPPADFVLQGEDLVVLAGTPRQTLGAIHFLEGTAESAGRAGQGEGEKGEAGG